MAFYDILKNYIEAGVPAICIETTEWERLEAELTKVCKQIKKEFKTWNPMTGIDGDNEKDFISLIVKINNGSEDGVSDITVIEYADRYICGQDQDTPIFLSVLVRELRNLNRQIILIGTNFNLPTVLKKALIILDFPLPDRDDIKKILKTTAKDCGLDDSGIDTASQILDSVKGLGTTEIRNAFSKVLAKHKKIQASEISLLIAEKEQIIRKNGYLEYIKSSIKLDDIGGLENLKKWLQQRKVAFGKTARDKKLQAPKGVLLLGIPGTGKSMSAKAIASIWNMPLLRLDMARIFGGLVGESEANMRNTIKIAESLEPCVLWIDEIEKGLSGGQGGERDGGTSIRVLGTFLTWMQEKQKEIFIFATANDVSKLPPELLRKGRFDEIFFVDLPDKKTREKIFKIHLKLVEQNTVVTDDLVERTEGFSGAELESIVHEAHFAAHNDNKDNNSEITAKHLIDAQKHIVPLSQTMDKDIKKLREWAEHRCRKANDGDAPKIHESKAPKLPSEKSNMFLD